MLRSSVLFAFALLASLAGCVQDRESAVAARTELLDGGIIATPREWYVGNWCTASARDACMPVSGQFDSYAMEGVDLYPCVEYECRVFEYARLEAIGVSGWGRCFVRLNEDPSMCPISTIGGIDGLMDGAKSGADSPPDIEDLVPAGVGVGCTAASDECPHCVDGRCCENDCHGGSTNDCFACSVAAGGARDGLCTPVLAPTACSSGLACVKNERCLPQIYSSGSFSGSVFEGTCSEGESTVGLEIAGAICCREKPDCPDDSDGDKCTVPTCVDNQCIEKLAYEGCCVTDADCTRGGDACYACVETPRIGQKVCDYGVEITCVERDAGVAIDASVVWPDLGEPPSDASSPRDLGWDWDAAGARDLGGDGDASRIDGSADAALEGDADVPDAKADATSPVDASSPVPVTPVFRGGGGIRCAVSSAPGRDSGDVGFASLLGLAVVGWLVRRRYP